MLREGQTIEPEHLLISVRLPGSQSVELEFRNEKSLRPAKVVDTLGVHSQLRKSLLPDATLEIHDYAVYSGKRYIAADKFASTYAPAFGDGNKIVHNPRNPYEARLEITNNDRPSEGRASISYVYSRAAKSDGNVKDPLHNPDRNLAGATEIPDEFYKEVGNFVRDASLNEAFVDCFNAEQIRNERVLHWLMRTVLVPKQELLRLLQHGVMMIGDAVHAVPILGGHGANLAILDAINLAETFEDTTEATEANVATFYQDSWPGWSQAVLQSKKTLADMHRI